MVGTGGLVVGRPLSCAGDVVAGERKLSAIDTGGGEPHAAGKGAIHAPNSWERRRLDSRKVAAVKHGPV